MRLSHFMDFTVRNLRFGGVFFPLYPSSFTESTNHIDQAYLVYWQKRDKSQNNPSLSPEQIHLAS